MELLAFTLHSDQDILKFDGTTWSSVGGGIKGNVNSVVSMVVLNNELIVGGYFYKADGNADNLVMKWDGSNWSDTGWGADTDNGGLWKMLLYHNNVYAFGSFNSAGDKNASKISVYDGQKWCTYADSLDNNILSAAIYHDTIYIAGAFKNINGDTSLREIAKLVHPENTKECGPVGLKNNIMDNLVIKIFPNPFYDTLEIEFTDDNLGAIKIMICNSLGEKIYSTAEFQTKAVIDMNNYSPGFYFLTVKSNFGTHTYKLVKE